MSEYLRPDGDTTLANWTDDGDGTTNIYQAMDEVTASDTDFIKSRNNPGDPGDTYIGTLSNPIGDGDTYALAYHEAFEVNYRYRKQGARTAEIEVMLYQGATQIATWTHSAIGTSWVQADQVLTTAQLEDITDWDDLNLRVRGQETGGGSTTTIQLSWFQFRLRPTYLTLGDGTTHRQDIDITTVTGSGPYTVTVLSVPSDTVPGDALFDENIAGQDKYRILAINGLNIEVEDSEGLGAGPDSSGGAQARIQRYFDGTTPINDANTDLEDTNIFGSNAGEWALMLLCNDATFDENASNDLKLGVGSSANTGLHGIEWNVAAGEGHTGVLGTGVVRQGGGSTANASAAPVGLNRIVRNLEFDRNRVMGTALSDGSFGGSDKDRYINNLVHTLEAFNFQNGTGIELAGSTGGDILNNQVFDLLFDGSSGSNSYFILHGSSRTYNVMNNTCHFIDEGTDTGAVGSGIRATGTASNATWSNNLVTDTYTSDYDTLAKAGTSETNMSSDTTGTSGLQSVNSVDQYLSNSTPYDLRLKTGADAFEAGTDKVVTPPLVNIDATGRDRDAQADTWSCGAHQLETAVPSSNPPWRGNQARIFKQRW